MGYKNKLHKHLSALKGLAKIAKLYIKAKDGQDLRDLWCYILYDEEPKKTKK